jgi:small subunit ribosomal protein S16
MLRIRLRRIGKKGRPSYRMVVAEQQAPRDGAFLETLGSYDPHVDPPVINLNEDRAREWMGKGAQPSEAAEKILRRIGVITTPATPRPQKPSKAEAEAATKAAAAEEQARKEAAAKATAEAEAAASEAEAAAEAPADAEAPAEDADASEEQSES